MNFSKILYTKTSQQQQQQQPIRKICVTIRYPPPPPPPPLQTMRWIQLPQPQPQPQSKCKRRVTFIRPPQPQPIMPKIIIKQLNVKNLGIVNTEPNAYVQLYGSSLIKQQQTKLLPLFVKEIISKRDNFLIPNEIYNPFYSLVGSRKYLMQLNKLNSVYLAGAFKINEAAKPISTLSSPISKLIKRE